MSTTITECSASTSDLNLAAFWLVNGLTLIETFLEGRSCTFVFDDPGREAAYFMYRFNQDERLRAFAIARGRLVAAIAATRAAGRCDREQLTVELARRGWAP